MARLLVMAGLLCVTPLVGAADIISSLKTVLEKTAAELQQEMPELNSKNGEGKLEVTQGKDSFCVMWVFKRGVEPLTLEERKAKANLNIGHYPLFKIGKDGLLLNIFFNLNTPMVSRNEYVNVSILEKDIECGYWAMCESWDESEVFSARFRKKFGKILEKQLKQSGIVSGNFKFSFPETGRFKEK